MAYDTRGSTGSWMLLGVCLDAEVTEQKLYHQKHMPITCLIFVEEKGDNSHIGRIMGNEKQGSIMSRKVTGVFHRWGGRDLQSSRTREEVGFYSRFGSSGEQTC
jgi:hypothetical protein